MRMSSALFHLGALSVGRVLGGEGGWGRGAGCLLCGLKLLNLDSRQCSPNKTQGPGRPVKDTITLSLGRGHQGWSPRLSSYARACPRAASWVHPPRTTLLPPWFDPRSSGGLCGSKMSPRSSSSDRGPFADPAPLLS